MLTEALEDEVAGVGLMVSGAWSDMEMGVNGRIQDHLVGPRTELPFLLVSYKRESSNWAVN